MLAILLGLVAPLWAAPSDSLLRSYPGEVIQNEVVVFKPVTGNHFSPEAPQRCGSGQMLERSPRFISCQFSAPGQTLAALNVCDDKLTFCKPIEARIQVVGTSGGDSKALVKNELLSRDLTRTLVPGFVETSPSEVIKEAATRGQPVFVMISTNWCPSCNEAKEYLLSSPAFQKSAQNWFKVYVDGDSLSAADWEAVVPYRFFPSFVLLNWRMQEISRYTGELRQADFEAWAHENLALVNDPIVNLRERVMARQSGQLKQKIKDLWNGVSAEQQRNQEERLLAWALARNDRELVLSLLPNEKFPKLLPDIIAFQLNELERQETLEGKDLKAEKSKLLTKQVAQTLKGEHWGESLQQLCELDAAACKPFMEKVPERVTYLNQRGGLLEPEKESLLGDEYYSISESYQALGDGDALKVFALQCADHYELLKKKSILKISRAGQQGMIACLELAGAFEREEDVLKSLVAAYPSEPTFLQRMARMLRKKKKPDLALVWIGKAEGLAYGYNWINLELLKADILLDQGNAVAAKKVLNEALTQIRLEPDQSSRNQSLVAHLRSLQTKAEERVQN